MEKSIEVEEIKEIVKKVQPMEVRNGDFIPTNSDELSRLVSGIAKGGGLPDRFDTNEKRMAAYNLAHSLMKDQWQLALNHIAIINGQMCIYGELPGAIAERTGEVEEKRVFLIDKSYKEICTENQNLHEDPIASVCTIKRKGRTRNEYFYTLEDAKKAGQYPPSNPSKPWGKYMKIMLMRKSLNLAIKFEFPDALLGVPIAEYDYDELPEKDVTPATENNEYNSALKGRFT